MIRKGLLAVIFAAAAIVLARYFEESDYYDPVRGRRHCGAAPQEIRSWS